MSYKSMPQLGFISFR